MNTLRKFLGLEHNILIMLVVVIVLGMGEELWSRFIPKYLELLGAGTWLIAMYGTLKDVLDAVYQYPGGWLADRIGRKKGLVLFTLLAIIGYITYIISVHWGLILLGTVFVMAWTSLSSPAIFAIIGDTLPSQRRSIGFGVQSIVKRIPIMIAPGIGGAMIVAFGFSTGIRAGLVITIALALFSIWIVLRHYREKQSPSIDELSFKQIWRSMNPALKRLLFADCFVRWAEGIPKVFIVLYVMNILQYNAFQFGWLTSVQVLTSILVYIPIAKLSDSLNRKPFILLTFIFFALFPVMLIGATTLPLIIAAFVIAGLREIGEPARKALIVDLAHDSARGRAVGIYYLIRGLAVFPASIIGGWLWTINTALPFYTAFAVGVLGLVIYAYIGSDKQSGLVQS